MSGNVFGSRIRSSVSTFAVVALMAAAPALVAGSASAAMVDPSASPAAASPSAASPVPKADHKADAKAATKTELQGQAQSATPAKPSHVQIAATPKAEVTKTQADAVAKELGTKPSDALAVQLGTYHERIEAANALKDGTARAKAVTEARQQLTTIGGKPVTAEQAAKIDGILGVKTAPTAIQ